MADSTPRPSPRKASSPGMPRPDFPLNIHKGTGYCQIGGGEVVRQAIAIDAIAFDADGKDQILAAAMGPFDLVGKLVPNGKGCCLFLLRLLLGHHRLL